MRFPEEPARTHLHHSPTSPLAFTLIHVLFINTVEENLAKDVCTRFCIEKQCMQFSVNLFESKNCPNDHVSRHLQRRQQNSKKAESVCDQPAASLPLDQVNVLCDDMAIN